VVGGDTLHRAAHGKTKDSRMGTGNGDGEESMSRIQTSTSYAGAVIMAAMRRHVVYPISNKHCSSRLAKAKITLRLLIVVLMTMRASRVASTVFATDSRAKGNVRVIRASTTVQ
jgi:hypothetical protein